MGVYCYYVCMIGIDPYVRILETLVSYPEFRLSLQVFSGFLLIMVGVLLLLACLHALYYAGYRTPLYRRKAPVDGWNKRFVPALFALMIVIGGTLVGLQLFVRQYS